MTRASSLTVRFCSFSTYNFADSKDDDLKMPDYDEETKAKISGKLKVINVNTLVTVCFGGHVYTRTRFFPISLARSSFLPENRRVSSDGVRGLIFRPVTAHRAVMRTILMTVKIFCYCIFTRSDLFHVKNSFFVFIFCIF